MSHRRTFWQRGPTRLAMLFLLIGTFILASCGQDGGNKGNSSAQITYTYPTFNGVPKNLSAVQNAMNTMLKAKYGFTVKLQPIDYAAFDQKVKLAFTAGTPCDVVFTSSWSNVYTQNVAQRNFLALDDLLQQHAPQTYKSLPVAAWDGVKIDGKIYAVINQQLFGEYWGPVIRKDLADKYHLDVSTLHSYADLTPFLAQIKSHEPGVTPLLSDDGTNGSIWHGTTYGYDEVAPGVVIRANDPELHALNAAEIPEFRQAVDQVRQWHQAGYYTTDPAPSADALAAFKAGKYAVLLDQARPDEPAKFKAKYGYDSVQALFTKPLLTTTTVQGTMNAVCRASQHLRESLEFLEMLNTNKQFYNLITHGIEGKDYSIVNAGKNLIGIPATSGYDPQTDWMFGNQFNAYYTDQSQVDANLWPIEEQQNQQLTPSAAAGFVFDTSAVKTQVAQIAAVSKQYSDPLVKGLVDPATSLPQYQQALKGAGIDEVVTAAQSQLNTWKTTNKK